MIPPTFCDLGKAAKDLFDKNFHYGFIKAEHKSKTPNGMDITVGGSHNDSGKISGNLEVKYKVPDYGLTFTEKWTTANVVNAELAIEDKLIEGMKQSFVASFEPNTGRKTAQIKNGYKREHLHLNANLDFTSAMPNITACMVTGYKGYLGGIHLGFDPAKQQLSKINYAMGYQASDFQFHGAVNDAGENYVAHVYQRLSDRTETGVMLSWVQSTKSTQFGVGVKHALDKSSFVKAKVNNSGIFGLAYSFKAHDGVTLTLSGMVDGKNINSGGHKLGLALDFES